MKRLFLLFALALMVAGHASAQSNFGEWDVIIMPHAGAAYSHMSGNENKWKLGVTGGVAVQMYFTPRFFAEVDVNYAHTGAAKQYQNTEAGKSGPYDYRLDYLNTDYTLHYYPMRKLSFYSGIHLGTLINAKSEYNGHSTDIKDYLNAGHVSVPVGASLDVGPLTVDARFYWPINTLPDGQKAKAILGKKAREMAVLVTVGYKVKVL